MAPEIRVRQEQLDASTIDGERKTITALFGDIKGSTELIERLDPEEARAIIDPVLRLMMDAVDRYGGYIAQSTGDGIFALFGAPLAYEDHPQRALHASLAMQQAIHERATRCGVPGRPGIEARVGISTGEVVVRTIETGGHPEYAPIGLAANLASRLQTVAAPGSIAVSAEICRLCEGYFSFRALGPSALKGIAEPVEAYEVTGLGPLRTHFELSARRGLTRFVGREHELAALQRALIQAHSGHGEVLAVVAEAGTGKSRLFHEFKSSLPIEGRLLQAYSVSHGKASAWLPVLELLHRYFGIEATNDPVARREKVQAALTALGIGLTDVRPYLFALFGITDEPDPLAQMNSQVKRRRTLEAIRSVILRESLKQPLVIVFEDLHWVDGETQELLDLLVESIAGTRILLLVNYRPEYRHQWSSKSHYTQLRLDPLGGEGAAAMLTAMLGDGAELGTIKRLIAERTGGNPFFIEEMVQALFDEGALLRNGAVKVVRPLAQLRMPPTVQGILASRIDRLAAEQKDLLQTLAVMGRESPLGLIRKVVAKAEPQLEPMLAVLRAAEFIYEQPALTEPEYVFKHALTQEVAYQSILAKRRKKIHERVGAATEELYRDQLEEHLAKLAHHYQRSANKEKAIVYLKRAADQAAQRCSIVESEAQYRDAISILRELPPTPERDRLELGVQLGLIAVLIGKGWGASEREEPLIRAMELSDRVGDPGELHALLFQLAQFYIERLRYDEARRLAERAIALAQGVPNQIQEGAAWYNLAESLFWSGDILAAKARSERAWEMLGGSAA
jgi:predicted ATPase/class 3 adenylate cyclase